MRWKGPDGSVGDDIRQGILRWGGLPGFCPSVRRLRRLKSLGPDIPKDRNPRFLPQLNY